jgi:hypothetical protein
MVLFYIIYMYIQRLNFSYFACIYLLFRLCDAKCHSLLNFVSKTNKQTNTLLSMTNVLSLYCIFDVHNLVLCLNRELIKIIEYKFMLKLQCKTTFNFVFVVNNCGFI